MLRNSDETFLGPVMEGLQSMLTLMVVTGGFNIFIQDEIHKDGGLHRDEGRWGLSYHIKSYSRLVYHIISYHIISYHIISYYTVLRILNISHQRIYHTIVSLHRDSLKNSTVFPKNRCDINIFYFDDKNEYRSEHCWHTQNFTVLFFHIFFYLQ